MIYFALLLEIALKSVLKFSVSNHFLSVSILYWGSAAYGKYPR